jgi:stearoyl-CoA desaturase (delta-9 desaturase)
MPLRPAAGSDRIDWIKSIPFFSVHVAGLAAFWTGVSWEAIALCGATYAVRMFAITGGYHRYFAHRSYRTSRAFQFLLAAAGCAAAQRGPLWWAGHHRHHHRHSDQAGDVHSPEREGFWWSHVGWLLSNRHDATRWDLLQDFARYPELRLLNHFYAVPAVIVAVACFLALGWQGLVWGFFISTVLLFHATFAINSFCHMFGRIRYRTADASRNNLPLALLTLGEGWHNNHHYYASSTRMGFFWWEIDVTYYILKLLSVLGLVWDLKQPPARVLEAGRSAPATA